VILKTEQARTLATVTGAIAVQNGGEVEASFSDFSRTPSTAEVQTEIAVMPMPSARTPALLKYKQK
jgi:hypothetical protein